MFVSMYVYTWYGRIAKPLSASIRPAAWLNILANTMSDGEYICIDRNLIVQIGDYIYALESIESEAVDCDTLCSC